MLKKTLVLTVALLAIAPITMATAEEADEFNFDARKQQASSDTGENGKAASPKYFNPYDKSLRQKPEPVEADATESLFSVFPQNEYVMSLVRDADTQGKTVKLRLNSPMAVSGCTAINPPEIEQSKVGSALRIRLGTHETTVDSSVRYAHYQCDKTPKALSLDIVLDAEQLQKDGIRKIDLETKMGGRSSYDIMIDEHRLALLSKDEQTSFRPLFRADRVDTLSTWFYPAGTVALYASGAEMPDTLGDKITAFASAKGLVALRTIIPEFESPVLRPQAYYFVDQTGGMEQTLRAGNGSAVIGSIPEDRLYSTSTGQSTRPVEVNVVATLPENLEK